MKKFLCFFFALALFPRISASVEVKNVQNSEFTVIVDPGHGGRDGGAVGLDGVIEKDLNLDMSQKLAAFLELDGINVVMTRNADTDTDGKDDGFSKRQDILNRLSLSEKYPNSVFVSIHMNYSTGTSDKGFHAFFGHNDHGSEALARSIQTAVDKSGLANRIRDVKKAPTTVYLMKNLEVPAVLVECGFISNREDCAKLYDESYRMAFAFSLFQGVVSAIG